MAQMGDGSGKAPVSITKPTTSVISGPAVTKKLVDAAIAFGNIIKGTFGPSGLDKMMYKTDGSAAVTNDSAKIIAELLVKHPAAKAFVSLAETQENSCGDGVTACIIFASELMREAGRLLERNIHPLRIIEGYQQAMSTVIAVIEERQEPLMGRTEDVSKTAMVGRSTEGALNHLAKTMAEAVSMLPEPDYEKIRMIKDGSGNASNTSIFRGLIVEKRTTLDRMAKIFEGTKALTLTCPLELEKTTRDSEIELTSAAQMLAFNEQEEKLMEAKATRVINSGAGAIFCAESIDKRITHLLVDAGLLVVADLDKSGIEDVAETLGSTLIDHIDDISPQIMGDLDNAKWLRSEDADGYRERLYLDGGENSGIITLVVGGVDGISTEETIRGLFDALRSTCEAITSGQVLIGGGSLHIAASLAIREAAETKSGRERLGMEAFSRALEAIPATLAENIGGDRLDTLLQLRSLHRAGKKNSGVGKEGDPVRIEDALIPATTILHSIQAACETACGLIRVDQVISARGD